MASATSKPQAPLACNNTRTRSIKGDEPLFYCMTQRRAVRVGTASSTTDWINEDDECGCDFAICIAIDSAVIPACTKIDHSEQKSATTHASHTNVVLHRRVKATVGQEEPYERGAMDGVVKGSCPALIYRAKEARQGG